MIRPISACLGAVLLCGVALGQGASTIAKHDFESGDHGWQAIGATGRISVATSEGAAKVGKGALKFEYLVEAGEMAALVLPVADGPPKGMKSVRFWAKGSVGMPLVVALQERDGGRFQAQVAVPAKRWQRVELALSDFVLGKEKDDPRDADGKLDIAKLESISIADLSQMLVGGLEPELLEALGIRAGARELMLDDIEASSATLPEPAAAAGEVLIDGFLRPHAAWFATGSVRLDVVTEKPLQGRGLRLDYESEPGKISAAMRSVEVGSLAKAGKLLLSLSSVKATSILVQLEEMGGGKYNATVALEGGRRLQQVALNLADLKPSDDSRDANGKLDRGEIKQLIIADLSFIEGGAGANTIWIGPVRASKLD